MVNVAKLFKHDLVKGFACLGMVVAIWVASGFIAQVIFTEYKFFNFAAISVYSLIIGMINLLPLLWRKLSKEDLPPPVQIGILGCLWQAGQMLFVMSLTCTTMGTNMALQSASCAFSFLFSLIILKYDFRVWSAVGVVMVVGAVVLASFYRAVPNDSSDDDNVIKETPVGFILAITAAVCGALFSTFFKKWVTKPANSDLIFGFFGIIAIVIGIPLVVIFHFTGVQEYVIPSWEVALLIVADAVLCSVICNKFFFPRAFIYLTPVTVQVGLTLTIPSSYLVTIVFLRTHTYPALAFVAAAIIFLAVVVVSYDQAKYSDILKKKESSVSDENNCANGDETKDTSINAASENTMVSA